MQTKDKQQPEANIKLIKAKEAAKKWGISYWLLRDLVLMGKLNPIVSIAGKPLKGWHFDGTEINKISMERL
jgi:hypothetical protein